jgi:hypothetical protein
MCVRNGDMKTRTLKQTPILSLRFEGPCEDRAVMWRTNGPYLECTGDPSEIRAIHHAVTSYEENQKTIAALVEGYRMILRSPCCPKSDTHGNECPKWIAEEALVIAQNHLLDAGEKVGQPIFKSHGEGK